MKAEYKGGVAGTDHVHMADRFKRPEKVQPLLC